ncbi:hypothetical protein Lal_00037890 [Lupinus albus]|nr:hypothetical protein Lal_00037890 [Lupinus albus]
MLSLAMFIRISGNDVNLGMMISQQGAIGIFQKQDSCVMNGGGVLRDYEGKWLFGFSANFSVGSPILAELMGMDQGLRLAWNLGYKQITLESDCLESVQIILEDIHIRLQQIGKVVYEANQVADYMSKLGSHSSEKLRT